MKHFHDILATLGASNIQLVEPNKYWDFWMATYKTPITSISGYYLYLKHDCPQKESSIENLTHWKFLSRNLGDYEVIVTPKSPLSQNLEGTRSLFGAKSVRTTKQFLLDNFLKDLSWKPVRREEHFIDPDLEIAEKKSVHNAVKYLSQWIKGESSTLNTAALTILTAHGGIGKTTVSRVLCDTLHSQDSTIIPILIESEQWRHLIQTNFTMNSLWDLAISKRFERAGNLLANKVALRALVQEGVFVIIFDGFDELCVAPGSVFKPNDIISELLQIISSDEESDSQQARIILTTRETYWKSISENLDTTNLNIFRLKGFDNEQRKHYFKARLGRPEEIDIALRISKQISTGIYENMAFEGVHEERLSGVPFVLDLIAHYVHDNQDIPPNPYEADPFEGLLEDICKRESHRQTLGISAEKQLELFEELFRAHDESFTVEDLVLYLGVVAGVTDLSVVHRFTNHIFLTRRDNDSFAPRYEVLRVYFIARFLARGLSTSLTAKSERAAVARILAKNKTGKTQVIDWLVRQLARFDEKKIAESVRHAVRIINEEENSARLHESLMALFHLVGRLVNITDSDDKKARSARLHELMGSIPKQQSQYLRFEKIALTGSVKSFDLSNIKFVDCFISDAEFRNCKFNSQTIFQGGKFEGTLKFVNCTNEGEIKFNLPDGACSDEAEYVIRTITKTPIGMAVRRNFAEDALTRALRKFKGDFGYGSIQYRHRISGFKSGNPYNDQIWTLLEEHDIICKHHISNVDDGGLNISDDKELRREVASYLDNGVLGRRLTALVNELVK